ncbi:MAG: NAD(P)-dependent oxidoreductase, partial [Dehalococcoidia bacterium]
SDLIVGPGRIAAAVARRALGFGMRVLHYGRSAAPEFPGERVPLAELLAKSDFVSVHVPLTEQTAGMCDAAFFAAMKPSAIFVNTARGGVVDQDALIEALRTGQIAGAALDVMTPEPLPPDHPLLTAPHLVVAPHLGSATEETRARMAHLAVGGLLGVLAGDTPANVLNPEAAGVDRSAR